MRYQRFMRSAIVAFLVSPLIIGTAVSEQGPRSPDELLLKPPVMSASEPAAEEAKSAEVEALEKFFTAETIDASTFAQSFLDQVPAAKLKPIRDQVIGPLGKFRRIAPDEAGDGYRAVFEKGYVPTTISLDADGKIRGLFLKPPVLEAKSSAEVIDALEAMDGTVALYVTHNGSPIYALNAERPMAVGSTLKLSVLAALLEEIEDGDLEWSDVYKLEAADKSLPSGVLHEWPEGAVLTVYSLAARMISRSDNTATDALIHLLGRSAVEAQAPERNRPFLTTREAFILKSPKNANVREAWLAADTAGRRELLADIGALPLPTLADFEGGDKMHPEIEWFYTGPELCALMDRVDAAEVMQINTGGLPEAEEWKSVSFKGGSEPGVHNLTYQLTDADGDTYCVTASRNQDDPDAAPFVSQVQALIGTLGE